MGTVQTRDTKRDMDAVGQIGAGNVLEHVQRDFKSPVLLDRQGAIRQESIERMDALLSGFSIDRAENPLDLQHHCHRDEERLFARFLKQSVDGAGFRFLVASENPDEYVGIERLHRVRFDAVPRTAPLRSPILPDFSRISMRPPLRGVITTFEPALMPAAVLTSAGSVTWFLDDTMEMDARPARAELAFGFGECRALVVTQSSYCRRYRVSSRPQDFHPPGLSATPP